MKKAMMLMLAIWGASLFIFNGPAQAVTFTISDIGFSDLNGEDEFLRWEVTSLAATLTFDLTAGNSHTFTYGYFTITNPINSNAGADNNDTFTASFYVMPPNPAAPGFRIGSPDATFITTPTSYGWVDFNNDEMERTFDLGGQYFISFLDTSTGNKDQLLALQATIRLVSDTQNDVVLDDAPIPAPEPGTFLLLGVGIAALALGRNRLRK